MGFRKDESRITTLKEKIDEYSVEDILFLRKAIVAHYFNEPFTGMEERLGAGVITALYETALYLIDTIDMAPFKMHKKSR